MTPHVTAGRHDAASSTASRTTTWSNVQHDVPATLNYAPPGHPPYPASICTSVNHVVCHGIPGDKKLKAGDIVNIDVTVIKDGYHGDTSRMFYVGDAVDPGEAAVSRSPTRRCGAASARSSRARSLGDIGATIQRFAESHGFSIVREFCGHGIGRQFHEEPQVLHYGTPGHGPEAPARHDLHRSSR